MIEILHVTFKSFISEAIAGYGSFFVSSVAQKIFAILSLNISKKQIYGRFLISRGHECLNHGSLDGVLLTGNQYSKILDTAKKNDVNIALILRMHMRRRPHTGIRYLIGGVMYTSGSTSHKRVRYLYSIMKKI